MCAAAGNFPAQVTGMSANGFKAVIDIDLLGTFNTCRAAFEHLRKPGASIISISASHANTPITGQAHVCSAKARVELLDENSRTRVGTVRDPRELHYAGSHRRYRRNATPCADARGSAPDRTKHSASTIRNQG
ncbi:MAG: SDR family oxidoreductase [Bryobacterales bacterium]|nr:SDR family oxidoreductase [Bryobacterales bacterium]